MYGCSHGQCNDEYHYSKCIIEAHNGYVEVQSELGKGSTFIVKFPSVYYRAARLNPEKGVGAISKA